MALIGTPNYRGKTLEVLGVAGTGDNAVVIELDSVGKFDQFSLQSSAGVMDVEGSLDGVTFSAPLALEDKHSTTPGTRVVSTTVAGNVYLFQGVYKALRVRQAGATAVANAVLLCGTSGRGS
jgi:hypothetical protein